MITDHEEQQRNGLHKQLTNRLIELWSWHRTVVTFHSTGVENFFHQRCNADAQPEMKALADAMQLAYYTSTPKELSDFQWHLPYIQATELLICQTDEIKQVSAARCARVSYLGHDGKCSPLEDLKLYNKLTAPGAGHWSPLEHVCTPARTQQEWGQLANEKLVRKFPGWVQLRHMVEPPQAPFIPNHPLLRELRMKMVKELETDFPEYDEGYWESYTSHITQAGPVE